MDKQKLRRLRRDCFYVLQMLDGKYLVEFRGREVYYRYADRRVRYVFHVLARDYTGKNSLPSTITSSPEDVHEKVLEKVERDDLPTYIGWPLTSPGFASIFSGKKPLRIKARRKRLNKRMLYAKN